MEIKKEFVSNLFVTVKACQTLHMISWTTGDTNELALPPSMMEQNANKAPANITLFKFGLDILMYLLHIDNVIGQSN